MRYRNYDHKLGRIFRKTLKCKHAHVEFWKILKSTSILNHETSSERCLKCRSTKVAHSLSKDMHLQKHDRWPRAFVLTMTRLNGNISVRKKTEGERLIIRASRRLHPIKSRPTRSMRSTLSRERSARVR